MGGPALGNALSGRPHAVGGYDEFHMPGPDGPQVSTRPPSDRDLWQHEAEEALIHGKYVAYSQFTDMAVKEALFSLKFGKAWYLTANYVPSRRALAAVSARADAANDMVLQTSEQLPQSGLGAAAYVVGTLAFDASDEVKLSMLKLGTIANGAALAWSKMPEITREQQVRLPPIRVQAVEPYEPPVLEPNAPQPEPVSMPPKPTGLTTLRGKPIEQKYAMCTSPDGKTTTPFFDISEHIEPMGGYDGAQLGEQTEFYVSLKPNGKGTGLAIEINKDDPLREAYSLSGADVLISWIRYVQQKNQSIDTIELSYPSKSGHKATNYRASFKAMAESMGIHPRSQPKAIRDATPAQRRIAAAAAPTSKTLIGKLGFEIVDVDATNDDFHITFKSTGQSSFSDGTFCPIDTPRPSQTVLPPVPHFASVPAANFAEENFTPRERKASGY